MTDAPNPWDLVLAQINKIEMKVDRVGERVVGRDEFERYKGEQEKKREALTSDIKEQAAALATYKEKTDERDRADAAREQDEKNRERLFWAGIILSPIAGGLVAWIVSGGITP